MRLAVICLVTVLEFFYTIFDDTVYIIKVTSTTLNVFVNNIENFLFTLLRIKYVYVGFGLLNYT